MKDLLLVEKRQRMSEWIELLRGSYQRPLPPPPRRPLDQLILEVIAGQVSRRRAAQTLQILRDEFVDWNEVRVSRDRELAKTADAVGLTDEQAGRLRTTLTALFDRTNVLSLDHLRGKPHHEVDALMGTLGVSQQAAAATAFLTLELNVLALAPGVLRVLERLGAVVPAASEDEALEELGLVVAAAERADFYWLFAAHARGTCRDRTPGCSQCVLLHQ